MIHCANCGTSLQDDATFCSECGTKVQKLASTGPSAPTIVDAGAGAATVAVPTPSPGQFQHFLKASLPDLIKKVLFDPLDGTKKILNEVKEPLKVGVYCILISSFVITMLIYLRIPSELRRFVDFFEFFIRAFFLPIIGAFIITFFSFIIKAINNSQKANFGNEFMTGGIVSLGYALFFLLAFLLSYILQGNLVASERVYSDYGVLSARRGPPIFSYILIFSVFIYLFVISSNSLSQSLRSSGVKDGPAFYLSPFLIVLCSYLTLRLWISLFGSGLGVDDMGDIFDFDDF